MSVRWSGADVYVGEEVRNEAIVDFCSGQGFVVRNCMGNSVPGSVACIGFRPGGGHVNLKTTPPPQKKLIHKIIMKK